VTPLGLKEFSIVVAMDRKRGIGNKGDLPWPKLKGDMKFFRELTTCPDREAVEKRWGFRGEESGETTAWSGVLGMLKFAHRLPEATEARNNAVIMGRKTWESLPLAYRPLPDRKNGVLSLLGYTAEGAGITHQATSWHQMLFDADRRETSEIMVIGGGQIFRVALSQTECAHLYVTEIDAAFECDTFFPETPDFAPAAFSPWIEENGIRYRFTRWDRVSESH